MGYQTLGYFAATSRYGTPSEFMAFVDRCHQAGLGVLLDWTPAHFPRDSYGLIILTARTSTNIPTAAGYPSRLGHALYNYGRNEVQNFLISNALFWLDKYHIDGLRVDAVASCCIWTIRAKRRVDTEPLRRARESGCHRFLKRMNEVAYLRFPGVLTIAEESRRGRACRARRISAGWGSA